MFGPSSISAWASWPKTIDQRLRLSLEVSNSQIVPFEPIPAWVILRNESDKSAKLWFDIWSNIRFWIAKGDEEFQLATDGMPRGCSFGWRQLEPGQAMVCTELLFMQIPQRVQTFLFREPGQYRVKVVINDGRQVLESNIVAVEVRTVSREDASAAKLIRKHHTARMIQRLSYDAGAVVDLEQIVTHFPNSARADSAHHALAGYYLSKYCHPLQGAPKDIVFARRSAQHFAAVSPRVPALRADALLQLGHFEHIKDANILEIIHEMELLKEHIPDPEMRQKLEERRMELQKIIGGK